MKIVIAPDSFKGNMRSSEVCRIIRQAVSLEYPDAEVLAIPMADGGEGTVDAVVAATGGELCTAEVCGPLGDTIPAQYGVLPDGSAVMEMASASGLELVPPERLNPLEATTYGTGQLMLRILEEGHDVIVMGIGGSATVDGGTGMAQALGYRFRDADGEEIRDRGGRILQRIRSIDTGNADPRLAKATVRVACDVTSPLTGPSGAAEVYGPQKGATAEMVEQLEKGLSNLMDVSGVEAAPGDGAAGGLGYGLRAFCQAEIVSGAALIAQTVGLQTALKGADLLITGEGRSDGQTAAGKLCSVIAGLAREQGVRTALISGALQGDLDIFLETFDYAFSISSGHASLESCIRHAKGDLAFLVGNIMRLLKTSWAD